MGLTSHEKVLPKNVFLLRKIGTRKTQVIHPTRLRQFTPRQSIPVIQITPYEWEPDPEVIIKHDDLYARAWECEYEKPIFDSDNNNLVTPNSSEITLRSEEAVDETDSTPGTTPAKFPEICPQTDRSCDGTDTDHHMQPDVESSEEQPDPTPTNPADQNVNYVIIQSQLVMMITDIECARIPSTERVHTFSGNPRNVWWNWYAKHLHTLSSAQQSFWNTYWALQIELY